jgi:antitoxin HicB
MKLAYDVKLEPDDNGTFLVTCPALPEVTTFGETEEEALRHVRGAIAEALAARIAGSRDIPIQRSRGKSLSAQARLSALEALKVELYLALRRDGVSRAELGRRLQWKRESVDRLFRLNHASKLDQIDAAFSAINRRLEIRSEHVQ